MRVADLVLGMVTFIGGTLIRVSASAWSPGALNGKTENVGGKNWLEVIRVLLAGGNWNNGANYGSRYQNGNNYQWNTNSYISVHLVTRIQVYKSYIPG